MEHYIVTVEGEQLRIYAEAGTTARLQTRLTVVETIDFAAGDRPPRNVDVPIDSRFHRKRKRPSDAAERPPSRRELARRTALSIAGELEQFLRQHSRASWDFATTPEMYSAVAAALSPDTLRRLKRVWSDSVARHKPEEVHAHFALSAWPGASSAN